MVLVTAAERNGGSRRLLPPASLAAAVNDSVFVAGIVKMVDMDAQT